VVQLLTVNDHKTIISARTQSEMATDDTAAVIYMMAKTGFRVGGKGTVSKDKPTAISLVHGGSKVLR